MTCKEGKRGGEGRGGEGGERRGRRGGGEGRGREGRREDLPLHTITNPPFSALTCQSALSHVSAVPGSFLWLP